MALRAFMFFEDDLPRPEIEKVLWPLVHAAKIGTLSSVSPCLLTKENLLYKFPCDAEEPSDPDWGCWFTVLDTALEHGHLNQIPSDVIAALATEVLGEGGGTLLHSVGRRILFDELPESVLTPENLFRRFDSSGRSPALCAIQNRRFSQIPSKLRKTEYLALPISCGWTLFHSAAEGGFLRNIPKCHLIVRTMSLQTYRGITPLHLAARHCHLDQVPSEAFSVQTLQLRDSEGNTPLHIASTTRDGLRHVPRCLQCAETLMQENGQGDTVLHILWREHDPASIDPGIYTPENLNLKGRGGVTIWDYAEKKDALKLIPKKRLDAGRALRQEQLMDREDEDIWH